MDERVCSTVGAATQNTGRRSSNAASSFLVRVGAWPTGNLVAHSCQVVDCVGPRFHERILGSPGVRFPPTGIRRRPTPHWVCQHRSQEKGTGTTLCPMIIIMYSGATMCCFLGEKMGILSVFRLRSKQPYRLLAWS